MRITSAIIMAYLMLNGWVMYLKGEGWYESINAESVTLPSTAIDNALKLQGIQDGAASGDGTLFGVFSQAFAWFVGGFLDLIFGFPALLISIGVPAGIVVAFIATPMTYIGIKEAVYIKFGRDL